MTTLIQPKEQPLAQGEVNSKIREFLNLIKSGFEAFQQAGNILAQLVDDDPHVTDLIIRECPQLTPNILGRFEQIGRGMMHPALAMDPSPAAKSLRKLPLSLQVKYQVEMIPVVVINGQGEPDVLLINYKDMTQDQIRQVFRNDRVATEGEQRAWIADKQGKAKLEAIKGPPALWMVRGRKIIVTRACELTEKDLESMKSQLKR